MATALGLGLAVPRAVADQPGPGVSPGQTSINAQIAAARARFAVTSRQPHPGQPEPLTHPELDHAGSGLSAAPHPKTAGPNAAVPGASSSSLPGLDVSSYQGNVDWTQVGADGARFTYVKATEGTYYTNPYFSQQYTGSYNQGLVRGAYHFANPDDSSGAAQADFFAANGGAWSANNQTLPGALDIENNPYGPECYGLTQSQMLSWITAFLDEYHAITGRWPVIYSTTVWLTACVGDTSSLGANDPLWIANYNGTPDPLPVGWSTYAFWQFADQGTFPGDQDSFNGTYEQLVALANGGQCPSGAWWALSLEGGAVPAAGTYPPSCRAESGRTDLRGGLTSETVRQPLAVLAPANAPAADEWYSAVEADNVVQPLVVHANGQVVVNAGNAGFLSLENDRVSLGTSGWTPLALQNGWHQARGVDPPSWSTDGAHLDLRGGLNGGATGQVIAQLPTNARPSADEWYSVVTADNVVGTLYIRANGQIILHAGHSAFLALDGIRVPLAGKVSVTPLMLQNGWHQAAGVDSVGVSTDGTGFATLSGGTNGGSVGQVVATLPTSYRPAADVWFSVVTANDVVDPLVVHANGDIVLNAGDPGFLSLAGLRIPTG